MWFQQNDASAHLSKIIRDHLNLTFPSRWIGYYGSIAWYLRSPGFNKFKFLSMGVFEKCVRRSAYIKGKYD